MTAHADPPPDPLAALEAEEKLRDAVNKAHATFNVKPSPATADALQRALTAWRGDTGLAPIITAIAAELFGQSTDIYKHLYVRDDGPTDFTVDGKLNLVELAEAVAKITGAVSE